MSVNKKKIMPLLLISILLHKISWGAEFNPEEYAFSKLDSIKIWLHPHFIPYIDTVQKIITQAMFNNIPAMQKNNIIHKVINNEGDTRFYGKTFPILPVPVKLLLNTIKELREQDPNLVLLEVGGADGLIALLMIFAMGPKGTLIYNDLSKHEIEKGKERFNYICKITDFPIQNIVFDIGDAKQLSTRLPYKEKVALAHVQNVEHFMNPLEHQIFVGELLTMVCKTGYIITLAHTIPTGYGVKGNPFFDEYIKLKSSKNKSHAVYPMFLQYTQYSKQLGDEYTNLQIMEPYKHNEKTKIYHPEDNAICGSTGKIIQTVKQKFKGKEINCYIIEVESLLNHFTPTIYNKSYTTAAETNGYKVQQEESCFITNDGRGVYQTFTNNEHLTFALSVFRKI